MRTKTNSIFLKARYLSESYKETEELYEEYRNEFLEKVKGNIEPVIAEEKPIGTDLAEPDYINNKKDNDLSDDELRCGSVKSNKDSFLTEDLKKIYKKIVMVTHPDRHPEHLSEEQKKEMLKVYNKSANAISEGDLFSLLECASELYIDLPPLSDDNIKNIEDKCDFFEKRIANMKNTYPWVWGIEKDENIKNDIIDQFLSQKEHIF